MAKTNGTLTQKISSSVSSPTVNYSVKYSAERATASTKTVSIKIKFTAWLNSSGSWLGTGYTLRVYARISKQSWASAEIKNTNVLWSGTGEHYATVNLSADMTAASAEIEYFVKREDSKGKAGTLGSADKPYSGTVILPAYSSAVKTYHVTYSVSGAVPAGYAAPTDSTSYASGSTVTVKAVPTVKGYSFGGWYLNGAKVTGFKITGDTTLTGVWTKAGDYYSHVKAGGVWKRATPHVKIGGVWKRATSYVKVGGVWKST